MRHETFTCDLTHGTGNGRPPAAAVTHRLTLDGKSVDIDLCPDCLDPLAEYMAAGRPARQPYPSRTVPERQRTAKIRAWAISQGLLTEVARGRLPARVIAAYETAGESR